MPTLAQDLAFAKAGLDELERYLLAEPLFWPLPGEADLQRLTPGGLLLSLRCIQARSQAPEETSHSIRLEAQLDILRGRWSRAWGNKCRLEAHARINLWSNYLADYNQSPEDHAGSYPLQVKWRVILQLLISDPVAHLEKTRALLELDTMVKSCWVPGMFIWEPALEQAFREPEYWFLYGKLRS